MHVLSYSATDFGGSGRAVVAFGDVDTASSVSWHVFGVNSSIRTMAEQLKLARNAYEMTVRTDSEVTAASIAWIGYDAPDNLAQATTTVRAEEGGARLAQDVVSFQATRAYLAARQGGEPVPTNHLFGHRYGATTVSEAAADARLAREIGTVTMLASPGAGRVQSAAEYGADVEVYVASSSRDWVAGMGANTPGARGRLLNVGLGVNPAIDAFGATRMAAEIPIEGNTGTKKTVFSRISLKLLGYPDPRFAAGARVHSQYYWFTDEHTRAPTEALANIGRIAAGHGDSVRQVQPRAAVADPNLWQRRIASRSADPEAQRPLRFRDGALPPPEPAAAEDTDALVREALALRGDGVRPADLMHRGYADDYTRARELATANALWWDALRDSGTPQGELSPMQRAMVRAHPFEVGNADGIPAHVKDQANRLQLRRDLDALLARRPRGGSLARIFRGSDITPLERQQLKNIIATQEALNRSTGVRPGIPTPPVHLLAYDGLAFGGEGRAVVAIGNVDTAAHVAWQVPGVTTTVEKLTKRLQAARDPYEAMVLADPTVEVASIAWIGYDAPSGAKIWLETRTPEFAEVGGRLLARDVMAYRAARAARAGRPVDQAAADPAVTDSRPVAPPPPKIHLFGHSYGSTTTGYAAANGRLARDVATITLVGSPGAGPVQHAAEFGIGAENVYVAKLSYDPVTGLGALMPGRHGRFLNMGLGINPSVEAFGARRVPSQFPAVGPFGRAFPAHGFYFDFIDADVGEAPESLAYFGLIATGHGDEVPQAPHRVVPEDPGVLHRAGWAPKDPEGQRTPVRQDQLGRRPADGTQEHRTPDSSELRDPASQRRVPEDRTRPEIQGHRGGRGLWSENTLAGFAQAMDLGVDVIELDVGLTRDGVPVIAHEQKIDGHTVRDTGPVRPNDPQFPYVGKPIRELTAEQIRTLDTAVVNKSFAGTQQAAPRGSGVPTLAEAAALAAGRGVTLAVEIKTDPSWSDAEVRAVVAATVECLRGYAVPYRVLGFDWRVLTHAAELAPDVDRVALVSSRTATAAWLGVDPGVSGAGRVRGMAAQVVGPRRSPGGDLPAAARQAGATMLSPERAMLTDEFLQQAADVGMPVVPYTVNDPDEMRRLIEEGVAGIVTDYPDLLRAILVEQGFEVPESVQPRGDYGPEDPPPAPGPDNRGPDRGPNDRGPRSGGPDARRPGDADTARTDGTGEPDASRGGRTDDQADQGRSGDDRPAARAIVADSGHTDVESSSTPPARGVEGGGHGPDDPEDTQPATSDPDEPGHGDSDRGGADTHPRHLGPALPVDPGFTDEQQRIADAALRDGGFDGPDGLQRSGTRSIVDSARRRATENADWWHALADPGRPGELSSTQQALLRVYPHQIGNADGLPAQVRNDANRLAITRDLETFLARRPEGRGMWWSRTVLSAAELKQLGNLVLTRNHLAQLEQQARQVPGNPPVHVLSYDATAFGGDGKVVVALGNVDTARTVNWHVPGTNTTLRSLHYQFTPLRHLYEETKQVAPDLELASIIWIGYDAPTGPINTGYVRAAFRGRAKVGGDLLLHEIAAFHATRAHAGTADPRQLTNRIFAHSYGSVTASFAGKHGRLAGLVGSIALSGSPGAGPVRSAAAFGIGARNVYVAASWRDPVTMFGADQPGAWSRYLGTGLGLGMDPSSEAFGARRIRAEFPRSENFGNAEQVHQGYLRPSDPRTGRPTESLANFGRIAAGLGDTLPLVDHRHPPPDPGWARRRVGTAPNDVERGRFDDGTSDTRAPDVTTTPGVTHVGETGPRDCAVRSLQLVQDRTGSRAINVAAARDVGMDGMRWQDLEAHAGGRLRAESHATIAARLRRMGNGATTLVVDEYHGVAERNNGVGAHAYVMTNDNGTILVRDPATNEVRRYQDWTPPPGVAGTWGIHFDGTGVPQHPHDLGLDDGARPASLIGASPHLPGDPDAQLARARAQWTAVEEAVRAKGEPVGYARIPTGPESNAVYIVEFADGSKWVYKPASGQTFGQIQVLPSGSVVREVARYRRDLLLGYGHVPPTIAWTGRYGAGSLQELVRVLPSAPLPEYSLAQRHAVAIGVYIDADQDHNDYLTAAGDARRPRGSLVIHDGEHTSPLDTSRIGIRSSFVVDALHESLHPDPLAAARELHPDALRAVLTELGIEPEAVDGEIRRLGEIQTDGVISGREWPGRIRDVPRITPPPEPEVAPTPEPETTEPDTRVDTPSLWRRLRSLFSSDSGPAPDEEVVDGTTEQRAPDHTPTDTTRYRNDCAPQSLSRVVDLTGSTVVRVPQAAVGPQGMTADQLEDAAGGRLESLDSRDAIADRLRGMDDGATILVVEDYHGPADQHGVGAHAYVMTNEGGTIMVYDSALGFPHPYQPGQPTPDVRAISGIVYTPDGTPTRSIDEFAPDASARPDTGIGMSSGNDPSSGAVPVRLEETFGTNPDLSADERRADAETARNWVVEKLRELGWRNPGQLDDVRVVVSELVANALDHTSDPVRVVLEVTGDAGARTLRVDVIDTSSVQPELAGFELRPDDLIEQSDEDFDLDALIAGLGERGRGLPMVADMTHASGTIELEAGKSTWFVLRELLVRVAPQEGLAAAFARYGDTGGGWTGADSTYSRRLPDGRHLWMFSDTFLGTVHPDGSRPSDGPFVNNTFVVDDNGEMSTIHGGTQEVPQAVVQAGADGFYWLGGSFVTGSTLNVMFVGFSRTGAGMWDFAFRDNVLARFDTDDLRLLDITPMPSETGVNWTAWAEFDGTHTYIYGMEEDGASKYMHLARVRGDDPRTRWEFFDGSGWSSSETDSARIMPGVANEYSVTRWRGRYLLITQDTRSAFGTDILAYVADAPTGPFTSPTVLYRTPETGAEGSYGDANMITYNAHEHPELRRGDTLIISYNVNSLDPGGVIDDVTKYRPRFIEVELNPDSGGPDSGGAPSADPHTGPGEPHSGRRADPGEPEPGQVGDVDPAMQPASEREALPRLSDAQLHPPATTAPASEADVEALIADRLAALGIDTEAALLLEASLLIEEKYLSTAVIADQPRPETIFGLAEWAGYLDARLLARQYGDRELTPDFIVALHMRLAAMTAPEKGAEFARPGLRTCVLTSTPTEDQIAAINENPALSYLPPPAGPDVHGVVKYPEFASQEEVRRELQSLCDWYNAATRESGYDPFEIAATLQHRLVSIHPLHYNGRLSRLLMNWSLENDGQPPSAIREFDDDFLTRLPDWVAEVRAGSVRYGEWAGRLAELGPAIDPVTLFGLEQLRERYRQIGGQTAPFVVGQRHDGVKYRRLLAAVMSGDALPDVADPTPSAPDAVTGALEELRAWAASFDDRQVQHLVGEKHAETAARLAAFQRGERPPVDEIIGTARELGVFLREALQWLMVRAARPGPVPDDAAGLFDMARALPDRYPEVAELRAAASTLVSVDSALAQLRAEPLEPITGPGSGTGASDRHGPPESGDAPPSPDGQVPAQRGPAVEPAESEVVPRQRSQVRNAARLASERAVDAALVAAVKAGDTEAFGTLYERHVGAARTAAAGVVRGSEHVDDVVAESFANVFALLSRDGRTIEHFRAYLLTTVRHVAAASRKQGDRQVATDDLERFAPEEPFRDTVVDELDSSLVARALQSLPERWRMVLHRLEIEGMKPRELASELGLTPNATSVLAARAREGLRQAYLQMHLSGPVREECRPVAENLGAYVRAGLGKRETTAVREHLATCADCGALHRELADIDAVIRRNRGEVPDAPRRQPPGDGTVPVQRLSDQPGGGGVQSDSAGQDSADRNPPTTGGKEATRSGRPADGDDAPSPGPSAHDAQAASPWTMTPAERALLDIGAVIREEVLDTGHFHLNEVLVVHFENGTAVYRPAAREPIPGMELPTAGPVASEVATFRFDHLLGFHQVPPTVPYEGSRGPGSLQYFVAELTEPLAPQEYSVTQRFMMAIRDAITGECDRQGSDGTAGAIAIAADNDFSFPEHAGSFVVTDPDLILTDRPDARTDLPFLGTRFPYLLELMDQPIPPEILAKVRAVTRARAEAVLAELGHSRSAIDGALHRLASIQARGMITAEVWAYAGPPPRRGGEGIGRADGTTPGQPDDIGPGPASIPARRGERDSAAEPVDQRTENSGRADDPALPSAATESAREVPEPIDDDFARCRTAEEVGALLTAKHGVVTVGFDARRSTGGRVIDVEAAREFARALDDKLTKHPWLDIREARIGPTDDPKNFAETEYGVENGKLYAKSIVLNELYAADPQRSMREWDEDLASGHHVGPENRPWYGNIVHEIGHAVDYAGGLAARREVPYALLEHYLLLQSRAGVHGDADLDGYEHWVREQFSRYCFDERGDLKFGEALAEAYAAVEHDDSDITEGEEVLYDLLMRHAGASSGAQVTMADLAMPESGREAVGPGGPSEDDHAPSPEGAPQHGTVGNLGEFRGDAREPGRDPMRQSVLMRQVESALRLIAPEEVSWFRPPPVGPAGSMSRVREDGYFKLPDGRTVHLRVGEVSAEAVAEYHARPDGSAFDLTVSDRARSRDVARAVADLLVQIRLATDPTFRHPGGRFAELKVVAAQLDQSVFDPARSNLTSDYRRDLADLLDHLGITADPVGEAAELLAEHDPELARRIGLEYGGVVAARPVFGLLLTEPAFEDAAQAHLTRLGELLRGEYATDVLTIEALALNGRMHEEQVRRIFDAIYFDPAADAARGTVDRDALIEALIPLRAAINDPLPHGPRRLAAIEAAIDELRASPLITDELRGAVNWARMRQAASALVAMPDWIGGVLHRSTGQVEIRAALPAHSQGTSMSLLDFLHTVDRANRGAAQHGLNAEYVVVIHDQADGRSSVEVLSRPRPTYRLPAERNDPVLFAPRPSVPAARAGGHTVDVGVGRSAFAVELTPIQDTMGRGLILQTELPQDFADAGQRRRNLGVLDPGPLPMPGALVLFADLLTHGEVLAAGGNGGVARFYINNVSAHYTAAQYDALAAQLPRTLAPGARIEVQWDMTSERAEGGRPGDRGHIQGDLLMEAIERALPPAVGGAFRVVEHTVFDPPGNEDYLYSIDAGASNVLNAGTMALYTPPKPDHRMVIAYEPDAGAPVAAVERVAPAVDVDAILAHDRRPEVLAQPTGDPATAHLPTLRQHYIAEVRRLQAVEDALRERGASDEEIARTLQNARREIGAFYKTQDYGELEHLKDRIRRRNIREYKDPLGPTVEYLREVKGLSWAQIIAGAKRPGGADLGLGSDESGGSA
ncbi:sigma-70 family RNA polymerase sigma factor [Nocardia sp. Marseille-Q1738]